MDWTIFWAMTAGALIGWIISDIISYLKHRPSGTIRIDRSNPEKDKYLFEVDDLDKLADKKYIVFDIDPDADLSQK